MTDYTGYLICSDFDGTLSCDGIPERNIEAIRRFTAAGGRFTLSSGRSWSGFRKKHPLPFALNAPMIALSGALIYDTQEDRAVEEHFLDPDWPRLFFELMTLLPTPQRFDIVGKSAGYPFRSDDVTDLAARIAQASADPIYKIVGLHDYQGEPSAIEAVKALCAGRYSVTANGPRSYEITALGYDKGYGVKRVKALVGAKTLVTVGDYLGDIPMFKEADLSFAVGNAAPELKAVADCTTVHAREGAIADVIERLEAM